MKAEHRKELQTNSLADALGRTMRGVRSGAGISWFKVFLFVAAVAVVLIVIWVLNVRSRAKAEAWALLQYNDPKSLETLETDFQGTKQSLSARFTFEFGLLWDGIRQLGASDVNVVQNGLQKVVHAADKFDKLAVECAEDNNLAAEAKYHGAVAYEALAVFDLNYLKDARTRLEELTKGDFKDTGYGLLAKKRLDQYNDPAEFATISAFYREYQFRSRMPSSSGQ